MNTVVVGLITIVCIVLLPFWRPVDRRLEAPAGVVGDAPAGITAALRGLARPGDHVLNPQPWGSWFEFALPDVAVAIDSRIEVFPADVWTEIDGIRSGAEGWQESLARWKVTIVVAEHDEAPLVSRLQAAGWRQAYEDPDGFVLVATGR